MLNPGPEYVVRAYLTAWADQDVELALSYMSEDIQWHMYIARDVISFAGPTVGIAAMRQRFNDLIANFELLTHRFDNISLVGQTARVMMYGDFRHRATGNVLDLAIRGVFTVIGKQITRCDEYHDEDRIRAFMTLVGAESGGGRLGDAPAMDVAKTPRT